jgi:signal peptidase I
MGYLPVLAGALLLGGAGWLRSRLLLVTVRGRSMEPALAEGDRVLVRRLPPTRVRRRDVVVLRRPPEAMVVDLSRQAELLVKRVVALGGDLVAADRFPRIAAQTSVVPRGRLVVLGDNPEMSLDSRHYGHLADELVVGVVLRKV